MRKLAKQSLVAAAMVATCGVALADNDANRCSTQALEGLYVFSASGFIIVPGGAPAQPKAIVEWIRFNGDGKLSSSGATRSLNGVVAEVPPSDGVGSSYSVANLEPPGTDCKRTLVFLNGPSFDLFIPPKGEDIWMIQTNTNNVFQGTASKVSR